MIRHIKRTIQERTMISIPNIPQQKIQLSSLEWVIGNWQAQTDNGIMEEYWYPILGDAMAGWFRWKKEDAIFLYEFMLIQQIESRVVLKIKHFDANLEGWEESHKWIEYLAWSSEPNKVIFKSVDPPELFANCADSLTSPILIPTKSTAFMFELKG